jgi:hypothetical protein
MGLKDCQDLLLRLGVIGTLPKGQKERSGIHREN